MDHNRDQDILSQIRFPSSGEEQEPDVVAGFGGLGGRELEEQFFVVEGEGNRGMGMEMERELDAWRRGVVLGSSTSREGGTGRQSDVLDQGTF